MVFSSITFLFAFLPLFILFYFVVPSKFIRLRNLILFLFSLIFYAWGEPFYIVLMIFSTVFDFINGLLIEKFGAKTKKSKIILIISLVGNLGLLGIFKYSDFIISTINSIFGLSIPLLSLPLPIGISFYTFQTLSYTIDVYRGEVKAQHNIINFGTYVTMFPQLIAGPIVQYKTVAKELEKREHNWDNIYIGTKRFCIGFIKKVFLANNIGFIWSEVLKTYSSNSVLTSWLGVLCFALQIYFDFSGYSDMAIGLGKMMGFNFLENFNIPYISKSISEFWRRWHISLGSWFREYVYIPLGGNKKGLKRQIINLSIVWFLTGFWHGASWNYVLWGIYYGLIIIIEKAFLLKKLEKTKPLIAHMYTMFIVLVGWAIFAIEDFSVLQNYLGNMFFINGACLIDNQFLYLLQNYGVIIIIGCLVSIGVVPKITNKIKESYSWYENIENILIICIFIISIAMLVNSTYNPFLYFRF